MGKIEELLVVLLVLLLLFGAKRIPELAKGIGQSMREVRKGFSGEDSENTINDETKQKASTTK